MAFASKSCVGFLRTTDYHIFSEIASFCDYYNIDYCSNIILDRHDICHQYFRVHFFTFKEALKAYRFSSNLKLEAIYVNHAGKFYRYG